MRKPCSIMGLIRIGFHGAFTMHWEMPFGSFPVATGSTLFIDRAAQQKCKEYKKKCPERRLCAIQHLQWPMNMSFPVCVPRTYVEVKMRVCELPPQPGDCGARFIRWFYNKHSNKCSWFYFQGCRGNQNNFKSKSECEQMCIPERQFDNKAHHKKPYVLAATSPRIISKPFYLEGERTSNQIIRPYYLRAKKVTEEEKELRRKRRLERRRMKRLRKLRRRRRRKGLKGKKKRREGKVKGRKKRNKNKKDRKNRRKNRKNRKKRKRKRKKKNRDDTTTLNPQVDVNSATQSNSRAHDIKDDISIVSIFDKTTDTLKSNIEKIKSGENKLSKDKPKE